jgi:hypothetical protein
VGEDRLGDERALVSDLGKRVRLGRVGGREVGGDDPVPESEGEHDLGHVAVDGDDPAHVVDRDGFAGLVGDRDRKDGLALGVGGDRRRARCARRGRGVTRRGGVVTARGEGADEDTGDDEKAQGTILRYA